jgi:hypothetical protein
MSKNSPEGMSLKMDPSLSTPDNKREKVIVHNTTARLTELKHQITHINKPEWIDRDKNGTVINEMMSNFRYNGELSLSELAQLKGMIMKEKAGKSKEEQVIYGSFLETVEYFLNNANGSVRFDQFKERLLSTSFTKLKQLILDKKTGNSSTDIAQITSAVLYMPLTV